MKYSILSVFLLCFIAFVGCKNQKTASQSDTLDTIAVTKVIFNADSAFKSIVEQCNLGARVPNSQAHAKCADYIVKRFKSIGLAVTTQQMQLRRWDGQILHSQNIIASFRPDLSDRIVIATHWESRPWADADPDTSKHQTPVMAANDGASGVAVMIEIARNLNQLNPSVGIDFICFDAEDGGAPYWASDKVPVDGSDWCLGSQYWAKNPHVEGYQARYGILLDMVGGQDARFCYEGISLRYARDLVVRVWDAAQRANAGDLFLQQNGGYAQDDHVYMNEVAGIPTIDIIPFLEGENTFGSTWHTTADVPANISKKTLKGVGQTLLQFLSEEK